MNPSYSYCHKCGLPWNHCKSKSVHANEHSATFATCQTCWENSTLEELKKYYTECYLKQEQSLFGSNHKMKHTLNHLLDCVEKEYNKTK